jgi:hypothetical protein
MAMSLDLNTTENISLLDSDHFLIDGRLQIVLDMETGDPDDFITLLFLLGYPLVRLKAVTVVPGTHDQIGFLRYILNRFDRNDLPLGVFT